jgi:hypothetical protein
MKELFKLGKILKFIIDYVILLYPILVTVIRRIFTKIVSLFFRVYNSTDPIDH